MNDSFKNLLKDVKSILILLPKDPYFDQVAASLALSLSLKQAGKGVVISCPSPMLVEFNRLVGVDKITSELGNKNLVISFADYDSESAIERVSYDTEGTRMSIVVIPKAGIAPPSKDQVILSYSGISAEVAILIGGAHERHFPALDSKDMGEVKLLHIGIQDLSLPDGKSVISFARPASSISEVVASLIKELSDLNSDIATDLLMGMYEGSKNFSNQNVTAETFKLASELMQAGGKISSKAELPRRRFPAGAFPMPPFSGENPPLEKPDAESVTPPKSWMQTPKIYKGTSVS
jgi:hypothetical protein